MTWSTLALMTSEDLGRLLPQAAQWVAKLEQACMEIGQPLLPQNRRDGETIGIRDLAAVRVMVLKEMPLPDDLELRKLAAEKNLITATTEGMTFGHGLVLKNGFITRHLIAHELVHVLQYERFGGIEPFLAAYVPEVVSPPYYPNGPLELEAERIANIVCLNPPMA